jgi:hypothetical protein
MFNFHRSKHSPETLHLKCCIQRHILYNSMLYYSYRLRNSWHKYATRFTTLHVSA